MCSRFLESPAAVPRQTLFDRRRRLSQVVGVDPVTVEVIYTRQTLFARVGALQIETFDPWQCFCAN